jgi:hypothetical protein
MPTRRLHFRKLAGLVMAIATLAAAVPAGAAKLPPHGPVHPIEPVDPVDPGVTDTVIQQGAGWELHNLAGYATDDAGQYFNRNLYMLKSAGGTYGAPLSPGVQNDVVIDTEPGDTFFMLDQQTVDEIAYAEKTGALTPFLLSIAEPQDGDPNDPMKPLFGRCKDKDVTKNKSINFAQPINLATWNFGAGFTGSLDASANIQGNAQATVRIYLKRYAIFGACIPYGVKFDYARANGNLLINYGATLSGTVSYTNPNPWEWPIAEPNLFSFSFVLGVIPVYVPVTLPLSLGLDLSASVTGSITYNGNQTSQAVFDYTCRLSGCSGSGSFNQITSSTSPNLTGSVSGHVKPSLWGQAAIRASLYDKHIAYLQVGIRPYLHGDLWGFYGNNCGDADADSVFETVDALTFDLDWQMKVVGQASLLGDATNPWYIYTSPRWHIDFWDLIGSDAIRPMLVGPASVPVNSSQRYDTKMRPCWPYSETVDYRLDWGDGTSASLSGAPISFVSANKSWPVAGPENVAATALRDAHGRQFDKATDRTIQVGGTAAGRNGMTWGKISHTTANGVDHVGCQGCNPYTGDTVCSSALPLLCIRTDGAPVPAGVAVDFNNGWIGGNIGLTAPVRGDQLLSPANADAICQGAFGPGYQMAEFHHPSGGWSWSSRGNVDPATRFWVSINDNQGNCWN